MGRTLKPYQGIPIVRRLSDMVRLGSERLKKAYIKYLNSTISLSGSRKPNTQYGTSVSASKDEMTDVRFDGPQRAKRERCKQKMLADG